MKKIIKPLTILVLPFFLLSSAKGEDLKKVAQTGLQFLKVDMLASAAAMGGAFTMAGKGANAMFYNPAGMSTTESGFDLVTSNTSWIADINYIAAGIARSFGNLGTVGVSFVTSDYGDIQGTRLDASTADGYVETDIGNVNSQAIGISYARILTDKFRVGGQVKFTSQALGANLMPEGETKNNEVSGLAYDFGTIFYPGFKSLAFGMSIRNFSPQYKYEEEAFELPLTFNIGTSVNLFDFVNGPSNSALLIAVDAVHPRDYSERVHVGAEYLFADLLAVRAGYKTNYDEEALSMGFGVKYAVGGIGLRIDYSYSQLGAFDGVSRITIGGSF